jgi:dihydropteroate synthase
MPVIEALVEKVDVVISIDTTKAKVAEEALAAGAHIVNDVSALRFDPELADVVARTGAPVVLMHMRGTPRTMQQDTHYDDTLSEIIEYLEERVEFAEKAGIRREQIVIDPGIGFGKSLDRDNFTILRNLEEFTTVGRPILVGPSRKAFLGKLLDLPLEDRVEATGAAVAVAAMNGANIVRVHDVKPIKRVVTVVDAVKKAAPAAR